MGSLLKHDLNKLISDYGLENYVETGTGQGECLSHALKFPFDMCFSVEIYDQIYFAAKEKFETLSELYHKDCYLFHGESTEKLPEILEELDDEPVLFFLDAHFPGADFKYEKYDAVEDEDIRVPLKKELKIIQEMRDTSRDVFIIDDLWLYEDGEYESGNLQDHLDKHFPNMGYTRKKLSGGQTSEFIHEMFSSTHNIEVDKRDQGYLLMFPKE